MTNPVRPGGSWVHAPPGAPPQVALAPVCPMVGSNTLNGMTSPWICLPPRWRRTSDPSRGVVVAARAPEVPGSGVRPELVLRRVPVSDDLDTWRGGAASELATRLDDFELEDEDRFELGGHEVAYRRFAHRAALDDLVCDQWAWLVDGQGLTLTCTVAREDYADYCDVFEAIAETFDAALVP